MRLQAISHTDHIAVSDLTRMECCSYPLRQVRFQLLRLYDSFFARPDVMIVPITPNVFRRASVLQAMYDIATVDAIHLATAAENGCQLSPRRDRCTEMSVRVADMKWRSCSMTSDWPGRGYTFSNLTSRPSLLER